jgi:hypothetical protein
MALGAIGTINFIEDSSLLDDGEPIVIIRKWKERLFSFPWKPLTKTKTIIPKIPSKYVYFLNGQMVAHPATINSLRRATYTNE